MEKKSVDHRLKDSINKESLLDLFKSFINQSYSKNDAHKAVPTVHDLFDTFDSYLQINDRSERYRNELKRIAFSFPNKPINELTTADFNAFTIGKSSITKNRYLSYLKIIFNYGLDEDLIRSNPLRKWKKSKELPRDSKLTISDLQRIYTCASPHLQWAIDVAFNLGVRSGEKELCSLKWTDVDYDNNRIKVYASKTKTYRYIAINEQFKQRLLSKKELPNQCEYIVSYKGRRMKRFQDSFQTACRRAGIEYKVVMYDIRHLFATTLLVKGADLNAVSKMLGHSSVVMTANTYYHYLANEQYKAAELLENTSFNQFLKERPVTTPVSFEEKITKEELIKLVWKMSTEKIGEKYGVSGKAIEKWCKKWNIEKPGRGYWARVYADREKMRE